MRTEFFETIRVNDAKHLNLRYHQKRYEDTLKSFGVYKYENLESFFNAPKKGIYRCKIIYNLVGIVNIEYFEYKKRAINSLKLVYDDEIDYSFKYADRDKIDTLYKEKKECDDILIVKNGYITDTSIANIAFFKDGTWFTPKNILLHGTTRQRYIDEAKLIVKDIKVEDLDGFSKIALLNAMIDFDIIPINKGDFFVK